MSVLHVRQNMDAPLIVGFAIAIDIGGVNMGNDHLKTTSDSQIWNRAW